MRRVRPIRDSTPGNASSRSDNALAAGGVPSWFINSYNSIASSLLDFSKWARANPIIPDYTSLSVSAGPVQLGITGDKAGALYASVGGQLAGMISHMTPEEKIRAAYEEEKGIEIAAHEASGEGKVARKSLKESLKKSLSIGVTSMFGWITPPTPINPATGISDTQLEDYLTKQTTVANACYTFVCLGGGFNTGGKAFELGAGISPEASGSGGVTYSWRIKEPNPVLDKPPSLLQVLTYATSWVTGTQTPWILTP